MKQNAAIRLAPWSKSRLIVECVNLPAPQARQAGRRCSTGLATLAATLFLAAVPALAPAQSIPNPSFEADADPGWPGVMPITGWTALAPGNAGLQYVHISPFADRGARYPDGHKVAFIQSWDGMPNSLGTEITGLTPGQVYQLSVRINSRHEWSIIPDASLTVGTESIGFRVRPVGPTGSPDTGPHNPYHYVVKDFTATAATMPLTIASSSAADASVLLDDLRIVPRDTPGSLFSVAAWTGDATSGVSSNYTYTHAYNFGTADSAVINGVTFTGVAGGNPSVAGSFSVTDRPNAYGWEDNPANNLPDPSGSRDLGKRFIWGGSTGGALTLEGLIPGKRYRTSLFGMGWDAPWSRISTFSADGRGISPSENQLGTGEGIRLDFEFTADAASKVLSYDGAWHFFGFCNRLLPDEAPTFAVLPWTGDATSGIGSNATYTHAYNFGAGTIHPVINGVTFTGIHGGNPSAANFSLTGPGGAYNANPANNFFSPSGSRDLGNDFVFGGTDGALTLTGLVSGRRYRTTLFGMAWDVGVSRTATFEAENRRITADENAYGLGNGIRVEHEFTADGPSHTIRFSNLGDLGWQWFGFANRQLTADPALSPVLTPAAAPSGFVQILGVEAGAFNPQHWQSGALNLVPDSRSPFLAPLSGTYRNIYAPSAVETPAGYRVFYGGWDGIPQGKDRLYSFDTDARFQTVANRHSVVLPGSFQHVCNVNALRFDDGSFAMFGTVYPVNGLNKPGFFRSDTTGTNWNGTSGEPYTVAAGDIVSISGFNPNADINGMNVILRENGLYRLYFGDLANLTAVHRASSADGKQFTYDGQVLNHGLVVNDVKTFQMGATTYYLMGMHRNANLLWYSLSTDGLSFPAPKILLSNRNADDRYITALGWVTRGSATATGRKLLGVLYGAGPVVSLDQNKIFARWLQQRVVFAADGGARYEGTTSHGPDRQLLSVPAGSVTGRFELYAEDGTTLIGISPPVTISAGQTYRLLADAKPIPGLFNTGVSAAGALLGANATDPHYQLIASADPGFPGPSAVTLNETWPLAPAGPWLTNGPESKWIAPRADQTTGNAPGTYTYRTTFDLSGWRPSAAAITGRVAVDDSVTDIRLNGQSLGLTAFGFGGFSEFTIPAGTAPFVAGTNTLDFVVLNGGPANNAAGLRVEMLGTIPANASNQAPAAGNDTVFAHSNLTTSHSVSNLLANDSDSDGDALAILSVTPGTNTAGVELIDGSVRHTPATGFAGNASFTYLLSDGQGGQTTGSVTVVVVKPAITGWAPTAGNSFRLEFQGLPATTYRLQVSTNLTNWSTLSTHITGGDGRLQIELPPDPAVARQFYRLAWP